MLVRTDPDHHRLYYLSIPRDLWVEIPGHGTNRVNTAYQIGGSALAGGLGRIDRHRARLALAVDPHLHAFAGP